jgi:oligopeptide transport system substrate-binding protein
MLKKRLVLLSFLLIGVLALAACAPAPADDGSAARIAELEAALAEAAAAGQSSEELDALKAELEALSGELTEAESAKCTYNAYRMGWVMDWADAGNMVDTVFGTESEFQHTFWQQNYPDEAAEFEDLVLSAYRNTDLESRAAQWQAAEKIIVEDVVMVIPIQHYAYTKLVSTDLNFFYPPFGAPKLSDWSSKSGKSVLNYPVGTAIPTLDLNRATDTTSSLMIAQMFDGPYKFLEDGTITPSAATGFEVSEDGTVFTINLREDAVWGDGAPVTAQHFVDGVVRLLEPEVANDYAYVMFDIVGAAEYNAGETEELPAISAVDDYTFTFTLNEPRSYFDSILAFHTFYPVRLDLIEQYGDEWTLAGNLVGNGAYAMVEHNPGENLKFVKSETYWDAANVSFDELNVDIITEPATCLAAFEAGEIDANGDCGLPAEDIPRLVDTPEFQRAPRPGVYYMGVNTAAAHTDNLTFRKALAQAVDKRTIIDNVEEQPWLVDAFGVIPPEIFGYQAEAVGYAFDLEGAQADLAAYMAEAGIEDAGDITIELWYNKGGTNQEILEAVEAMWEENLGIDVRTVNVEWATYLNILDECGGSGYE